METYYDYVATGKFNYRQLCELRRCLRKGIDVSVFANPEYDSLQMHEIARGLRAGVDVSRYTDASKSWRQMRDARLLMLISQEYCPTDIRHQRAARIAEQYKCTTKFSALKLYQIYLGALQGVDVTIYAKPKYTRGQMVQIRLGLERNLDVSIYADAKYSSDQMCTIRLGLRDGVDAHAIRVL